MIVNFEDITQELNEDELKLIPILINGFSNHSESNPIKAPVIVEKVNSILHLKDLKIKITEPRLRKCCNYIRTNALLPLIATSNGYFVSKDPVIISSQIKSLRQRATSINSCADGLEKFLR